MGHKDGGNSWKASLHIPFLIFFQCLMIILFGCFARYDPATGYRNTFKSVGGHHVSHFNAAPDTEHTNDGPLASAQTAGDPESQSGLGGPSNVAQSHHVVGKVYPMFQDVHVMMFIGFGFLMTFLKKYGLSSVSLNMLCASMTIQWSLLIHGWFHKKCEDPTLDWADCPTITTYVDLNVVSMINADFASAAILISFGVVLGTANPFQLLLMVFIETVLYNVNEYIGRELIGTVDAGDTIFVHMFGAYFGIAASRVLYDKRMTESEKQGANSTSDTFSMIGTIFLWMYWPSFNAGGAPEGDAQMRCIVNTYLSLVACCCSCFAISGLVDPSKKFTMEHIQNATLAGGVAVGAVADMVITPVGAIIIGSVAGVLSTVGYKYISPFLREHGKLVDTCGVHNLHGMPSLLGGMLSVLLAGVATPETYDSWTGNAESSLLEIFPNRNGDDWGKGYQAAMQMAGITVTLCIALVGGTITGFVMKIAGIISSDGVDNSVNNVEENGTTLREPRHEGTWSKMALPSDLLYDDSAYFHVED